MPREPTLNELRRLCQEASSHRMKGVVAGNRASKRWLMTVRKLLESPGGARVLEDLLTDADPEVRLCAAGALLPVLPDHATPVLEELRAGGGLVGFEAKWALREHQRGAGSQPASQLTAPPRSTATQPIDAAMAPSPVGDHVGEVVARFHSSVMSLGLGEAGVEHQAQLLHIADAYAALGFGLAARTIRRARQVLVAATSERNASDRTREFQELEDLDRTYNALFPTDAALLDAIVDR